MNKVFFFLFILMLIPSVNAFIFSDDFTDTNATDLNIHNSDWNTYGFTTNWNNKIYNNQMWSYTGNDAVAGNSFYSLFNNDKNFSSIGETYSLEFDFIDMNYIAGTGNHIADMIIANRTDSNTLIKFRIIRASSGGAITYQFIRGTTSVNSGGLNPLDEIKISFIKEQTGTIYDVNLYINSVLTHSINDTNFNSSSFRHLYSLEAGGVGTGQVINKIDNFRIITDIPTANVTFSNYQTYLGINYTNSLDYNILYICNQDSNIIREINGINDINTNLNCDNQLNGIGNTYTPTANGNFNIKFFLKTTGTLLIEDSNFLADINAPTSDLNNSIAGSGFTAGAAFVNMNLRCVDTISPILDFNIYNDTNTFLNTDANSGTTQSGAVNTSYQGTIFYGKCTDLAGNTAIDTNSFNFYTSCYIFLDEELGTPVSTTDINNFFNSLEAKSYLTGATHNFKSPLANNTCFFSSQDDTIRFDLNYNNGLRLYREFNLGLSTQVDSNIGVCLADPQDFFEQAIISARETPVIVQQRISRCYNLIDYTKYSRNDALSLSAFTITAPYDIKTFIDGVLTLLPFVNGANENEINLDVLIFRTRETSIPLYPEELSISIYNTSETNLDSNILKIFYINDANNNVSAVIDVYNDSTVIFTQLITTSPNNFTILLDMTDLNFSGSSQKVILTKTLSDGSTSTITRYFSFTGDEAILPPGLIAIMAFMFFIFAITLIGWRSAMGLYGLVITILTLGITTLAPGVGWIILIQAGLLITAIFIFIIYKDDTVRSF